MPDMHLVVGKSFESLKSSLFSVDIWAIESLGYSSDELLGGNIKTLTFDGIKQNWFRLLAKESIWKKRSFTTPQTLTAYVGVMKILDNYIVKHHGIITSANQINRFIMESFISHISHLSTQTRNSYLSRLGELMYCWNEWGFLDIDSRKLINRDDKPRIKQSQPRFLTASIQQQITSKLKTVSTDALARAALILNELGMRGSEVLSLKKDCLTQDTSGGWYLTRANLKIRNIHTVPISGDLQSIIKMQADYMRDLEEKNSAINSQNLLFMHFWRGKLHPYTLRTLNRYLNSISSSVNLSDDLGNPKSITSHEFRHTVGTNLINSGMSQLFVQKFLGHKSAAMTSVYAQIHDSTLRTELEKATAKLVDIKGDFYSLDEVVTAFNDTESIDLDAKWLHRNISAQALPNGLCTLPIRQKCPHANACLTCPSFRTDATFLSLHKEQLVRCNSIIVASEDLKFTRQAELNRDIAINLAKIVKALENDE